MKRESTSSYKLVDMNCAPEPKAACGFEARERNTRGTKGTRRNSNWRFFLCLLCSFHVLLVLLSRFVVQWKVPAVPFWRSALKFSLRLSFMLVMVRALERSYSHFGGECRQESPPR